MSSLCAENPCLMSSCTQKVDTGIYQDKAGTAVAGAQDRLNGNPLFRLEQLHQTSESYATTPCLAFLLKCLVNLVKKRIPNVSEGHGDDKYLYVS